MDHSLPIFVITGARPTSRESKEPENAACLDRRIPEVVQSPGIKWKASPMHRSRHLYDFAQSGSEYPEARPEGHVSFEPLFKSAALVGPPIVIVARGHDRTNSREMRRMGNRRQHLGGSNIRASIHSNSAIGIRQRRRPFDGVVAVVRFVQKGIPVAVRCVAPANTKKTM